MDWKKLISLSVGLTLTAIATPGAFATEPYKVLGEGIRNTQNGHRLQLACVGPFEESNERSCDTLQFLLSKISGESVLVGPLIQIQREAKPEIRAFVQNRRAQNHAEQIEGRDFEIFPWSNTIGGPKTNLGLALGMGAVGMLVGGPAIAGAAAASFGITLVVDLVRLPFRAKERILTGEVFIAKEAITPEGALMARDRSYWQLGGRKTKATAFRRLYKTITDDDVDSVVEGSEGCVMKEVTVESTDGKESLQIMTAEMRRSTGRATEIEIAQIVAKDAIYMLRDQYSYLPDAKHGFRVEFEVSRPSREGLGFVGQGNFRYCFSTRIFDAFGAEIWSDPKRCDNLRNGLTKMVRRLPACPTLSSL